MGQKVHPESMRVGYIHDWKSNWFTERDFSDYLAEDVAIRSHIINKLSHAGLSNITIRKDANEVEAPAPAPKPARRVAPGERVVVRAQAKYVRTSARKARLVCDHIRGKSVPEARAILAHANRDVARDWSKLLESAVANAENNHELDGDDLRVFAVHADEGPTLKRYRPRAMGRATKIRKRTSHLSITLTPKDRDR